MTPVMTRRSLIMAGVSAAALAAGFPLSAATQETIATDAFRALSARLTGAAVADLDAATAGKLLDGFVAAGRGSDLALLAADPGTNVGTTANEIVAAWYSGTYTTPGGPAAIDVTQALLWNALDFTKPPGECGGETGYWADPPQT